MLIRPATIEDIHHWLILAEEVGPIFRAPQMAEDKEFHEYMKAKISKAEAFLAEDYMTKRCLGIIGFSKNFNRITWFGVFEEHRNKGVGSKLLKCALNQLDWNKEITVETYPEEYKPGAPAKHIYRKFGFKDSGEASFDRLGNVIIKMILKLEANKDLKSFH